MLDQRFCGIQELLDQSLDACFTGWSGQACIRWPSDEVVVKVSASEAAQAIVIYAPKSSDFICVEPVTNVNDGFNANAKGIRNTGVCILAPGNTLRMDVQFHVSISP